tara:strand:- start:2745 stop:3236 length:492 start_codon:yes stop_codon:yes gene_type:complete
MAITYEAIQTTTLGAAAAGITFGSIASSWTDLRLIVTGTTAVFTDTVRFQFNGDTGTNYSLTRLTGNGSAASSTRATSSPQGNLIFACSDTIPCMGTLDIFSYAGSTYKTTLNTSSTDQNGSGRTDSIVTLWQNTAAITSIYIFGSGNLNSGTTATLYGILAA